MHQLTIDPATAPTTVTAHRSFEEAHRALLTYVIDADYYLWAITRSECRVRYRLLHLADRNQPPPSRYPRDVGMATIDELPQAESCCLSGDLDAPAVPGAGPR